MFPDKISLLFRFVFTKALMYPGYNLPTFRFSLPEALKFPDKMPLPFFLPKARMFPDKISLLFLFFLTKALLYPG